MKNETFRQRKTGSENRQRKNHVDKETVFSCYVLTAKVCEKLLGCA